MTKEEDTDLLCPACTLAGSHAHLVLRGSYRHCIESWWDVGTPRPHMHDVGGWSEYICGNLHSIRIDWPDVCCSDICVMTTEPRSVRFEVANRLVIATPDQNSPDSHAVELVSGGTKYWFARR